MNLDDLLKIESNQKILEFNFSDGTLLWPFIRIRIFNKILIEGSNNKSNKNNSNINYFKFFFNLFKLKPVFLKNKKIAIFSTTLDNNVIKDKKFFNRVYDYYNFTLPEDTIIFESQFNREYKLPRLFENVYSTDIIYLRLFLISKLKKPKYEDILMATDFIKFLKNEFSFNFDETFYSEIYDYTLKISIRLKYLYKYYKKLLRKLSPELVCLNCAYYGGESYIIKVAKEMGIKTAEFQHGVVSKMHPAYNYGEAILNSEEYKKYIPDYYLTYGEYWNNQIKIPGKTYVVGNPHFYESIKRYKDIEEEKNTILIVSQWTLTKEFVEIAEFLANNLKDKKIIFKMHPGEMQNYELIKPLETFENIEIKKDGDIYELLAKSESIIACYSTTVFEAMAFKKNIYILDNEFSKNYIPKEIGLRFKNNHELLNLIKNKVKNDWDLDIEYYFNSKWKENYKKFINNEVGLKLGND